MNVFDSNHAPVRLGDLVGKGGEALVYGVPSRSNLLAKIYHPAPRPYYIDKLSWMLRHPPENPTRRYEHASLAWPTGLLYDSNRQLAGYLMPYIQVAAPLIDVFNPRRRAAIWPQFDRRYLFRVARNLSAALAALHKSGYVVGDLNESNVMVTPSALVTLIDTDSFQVRAQLNGKSILHPCPVGKLEYTPPELQGKPLDKVTRKPAHDAFGLAVLIFQLLMDGSHPFRAQWLGSGDPPPIEARIRDGLFPYVAAPRAPVQPPRSAPDLHTLPPNVTEMFWRCFVDGHSDPSRRPGPSDWERAIAQAEKTLILCSSGHYYSGHQAQCPLCQPSSAAAPAASQPLLDPREQPAPGRGSTWGQRLNRQQTGQPNPAPAGGRSRFRVSPPPRSTPRPNPASSPPPAQAAPTGQQAPVQSPTPPQRAGSSPQPQAAQNQGQSRPFRPSFSSSSPFWRPVTAPAGASIGTPSRSSPTSPTWGPVRIPRWPTSPATIFRGPFQVTTPPRERLLKSLFYGGGLGTLAGLVLCALLGAVSWSLGEAVAWNALWAVGGAAAGLLRGWRPGYHLGLWVARYVGWRRFWQAVGLIGGAILGTLAGMVFVWAVFPVIFGLFTGARIGWTAGQKIYETGDPLGWERIWGVFGAATTAAMGWVVAGWISSTGLGSLTDEAARALATWLLSYSIAWPAIMAVIGGIGGALGGAFAGSLADLIGRFSGLID